MTYHENVKILAFVGLAGSGKSSAVDYLTEKGYPKVYFGGVILDGLKKLGLEPTQENEKPYRERMRLEHGKDYVVNQIVEQNNDLVNAGQRHIIADGLYSWTEYKVLRHNFPGELTVIAIVTPKHARYARLADRPERPLNKKGVDDRDWAEIENLEKGGPIAIADFFLHNDGDIEKLHRDVDAIVSTIEF
jgi:dephospho-CoA kinase